MHANIDCIDAIKVDAPCLAQKAEAKAMPKQISIGVLEARRDARIKKLASVGPLIQGSLTTVNVTCGSPNCRCARGQKHQSHRVTSKVRGKTKTVYVPVDRLEETKAWIQEHKRVKKLLKEISDLNEQILRAHVKTKRARTRNVNAAKAQQAHSDANDG